MNIQLRLTDAIKESYIDEMNLSGKAMNYLHRKEIFHIGELVDKWYELGAEKGIGVGTINSIKNGVVNLMIRKLPEEELIQWFDYLLDNNSTEDLKKFMQGFAKTEDKAA